MKRIMTIMMLVSMAMTGYKQATYVKNDEQTSEQNAQGQKKDRLNDEEIEMVVSAFSAYLKDSVDTEYMNGAISNAKEISRSMGREWDEAIYTENVDKVDSLMKEGIRLAKMNDFDSLLTLVEHLDMVKIYMHPANTVEREYDFHSALFLIYSKVYDFEQMAPKAIPMMEYSKLHFENLMQLNPEWAYHPLRANVLSSLACLYAAVDKYQEAIATCKEYVELMKVVNPEDDSAVELLNNIYSDAGITE